MKKLWLALAVVLTGGVAQAEAVLDCGQVNELGEALLTIGVALEDENLQIDAGSADHIGLAETVEGLAFIAGAEGDQDLANASMGMAAAWDANDRSAFTDALAEAVAKLAVIAATECE
jgi:hypothetical protein